MSEAPAAIDIRSPEKELSPPIVVFDDVNVGYEPGKPILKKLSLRIDEDDRIALLGPNGNGKSTFAKLLADRLKPEKGNVVRAAKLDVAYFAQHQLDELHADESPYEHVRRLMPNVAEPKVRSRAAQMGFSGEMADTKVGSLSGGERARLLIGLACFNGPNLLILDEPTNHLDIEARAALIEALSNYTGAVLLITHDRHLLDACAERLWRVADGTVQPYEGDVDQYRREVLGRSGAQRLGTPKAANINPAEKRAELAPLRKKIATLETEIEKLEGEIAALDAKLADSASLSGNAAKFADLGRERAKKSERLAKAEEEWLAASARREELSA
jgi:ATP-binding cassette subfamily F protein 3